VSAKIPDPALVERQRRMRKIVASVMVGALVLLVLAGVSSLVRRPDDAPSVRPIAPPPESPAAVAAPVETAPASPAPAAEAPAEPLAPAAPAARTTAPLHRPKPAAPHKARAPRAP
jgi:hypothetical protein